MDQAAHGLLQEASPSQQGGRFRPYLSTKHRVTRGRYITSNDKRGYIPVYEYPLNGQWIMMDIDDGYILWTGIWKALGNAKADIVKMLESQPDLAPQLRRVRGGYLKIQGTWMPYEVALRLARRVAWIIREDLVPLFGPTFPSTCLAPDQPGYGQILGNQPGKRRGRRALPLPASLPPPHASDPAPGSSGQQTPFQSLPGPSALSSQPPARSGEYLIPGQRSPSQIAGPSGTGRADFYDDREASGAVQYAYSVVPGQPPGALTHTHRSSAMGPPPPPSAYSRHGGDFHQVSLSPITGSGRDTGRRTSAFASAGRYEPYQAAARLRSRSAGSLTPGNPRATPIDLPPLTIPPSHTQVVSETPLSRRSTDNLYNPSGAGLATLTSASTSATPSTSHGSSLGENIVLPPIQPSATTGTSPRPSQQRRDSSSVSGSNSSFGLPPISALDDLPPTLSQHGSVNRLDSAAVLKLLALDDELLGRSRAGSSSIAGDDVESIHRDEDSNAFAVARPTHEQLWTRRRSLSAPPMQPDMFAKPQSAWSAAPNISLGSTVTSTTVLPRPSTSSPTQLSPFSYGESTLGASRQGTLLSPHPSTGTRHDEHLGEWWSRHNRLREHSAGDELVGTAPSHGRGLAQDSQQELSRASSSSSLASGYANVRGHDIREHPSITTGLRYYEEGGSPRDSPSQQRHSYSHFRSSSPLDSRSLISPTSHVRAPFHAEALPPIASESLEHYRFGRRRSPSPAEVRPLGPSGERPDELGNSGKEMGTEAVASIPSPSRADGG